MKMGIAALSVIIVLVTTLIFFNFYLEDNINDIISHIEKTNSHLDAKEYQYAFKSYKKANEIWEKKEKILSLHSEHSSLDEINKLFAELNAYFNIKEFPLCSKTCHILIYSLEHIISKSKVNLETIL